MKLTTGTGVLIGKYTVPEILGCGVPVLTTVMAAVPAALILLEGTTAWSSSLLTKVVASAVPFQSTADVLIKPVPLTCSVKLPAPGLTVVGTRGCAMAGTGIFCASAGSGGPTSSNTAVRARWGMCHIFDFIAQPPSR